MRIVDRVGSARLRGACVRKRAGGIERYLHARASQTGSSAAPEGQALRPARPVSSVPAFCPSVCGQMICQHCVFPPA